MFLPFFHSDMQMIEIPQNTGGLVFDCDGTLWSGDSGYGLLVVIRSEVQGDLIRHVDHVFNVHGACEF